MVFFLVVFWFATSAFAAPPVLDSRYEFYSIPSDAQLSNDVDFRVYTGAEPVNSDLFVRLLSRLDDYGFELSGRDVKVGVRSRSYTNSSYVVSYSPIVEYPSRIYDLYIPYVLSNQIAVLATGTLQNYQATGYFYIFYRRYKLHYVPDLDLTIISTPTSNSVADIVYYYFDTTDYSWNLPFKYDPIDGFNTSELLAYPNLKRVKEIDFSVFNTTIDPVQYPTVCSIVSLFFPLSSFPTADQTFPQSLGISPTSSGFFNITLVSIPQSFSSPFYYDYDQGGEIDLYEWANFRDRLDPADDESNCGTNDEPETEEEKDQGEVSRVDLGPESQESLTNTYLSGIGSDFSTPEVDESVLPTLSPASYSSRETLIQNLNAKFQTDLNQGQYKALRDLFSPIETSSLPVYQLPSTSVTVEGVSASINTSNLSIDFNPLIEDQQISPFFRFAYVVIQIGLITTTGWLIKNLLFSALGGLPSDGSKSSEEG